MLVCFTMCSLSLMSEKSEMAKSVKETRQISNFSGIYVSGGIDLYVKQGEQFSVTVDADNSVLNRLKTVVEDSILKIYPEGGWFRLANNAKVYVVCKNLNELEASGGSDIYIENEFVAGIVKVRVTGGSDARLNLKAIEVKAEAGGGSDIYLKGVAGSLFVNASGGSDIKAYNCVVARAWIEASGGSDVYVYAQDELSLMATGGSDIKYKGPAILRKLQSSGGSEITKE